MDGRDVNEAVGEETVASADFSRRHWGWFILWSLVGGAFTVGVVGILSIGIFVMPIAIVCAILLGRHPSTHKGALGCISGLGLPLLYVAILNRGGPGNVCVRGSNGVSCGQEYSPWPFLVAGLVLIAIGIVTFLLVSLRRQSLGDADDVIAP